MPEPRVTIVTPSFMRAELIDMCLRSVADQDYPHIEHIVVDGGSTDGTIGILREYEDAHGVRWVSEPDGGMYDAINKGLSMATGSILAYLNTDDAYLPWTVSTAVRTLQLSGADALFGDMLCIRTKPGETSAILQFYEPFDMHRYTFKSAIGQPTVFWRKEVTERIGPFSPAYRLIADCEYWLRIGSSNMTLLHVPEVMALQFDHGDTLRETRAKELAAEFEQLRTQYASSRPRHNKTIEWLRASIMWRWRIAVLLWTWRTGRGSAWPQFLGYMRENDVRFPLGFGLLGFLPRALRRFFHYTLIGDATVLSHLTAGVVQPHDLECATRQD